MTPAEARIRRWFAEHICPRLERERIAAEELRLANMEAARLLLHRVWTEAHDSPDYVKKHWGEFITALWELGLEL